MANKKLTQLSTLAIPNTGDVTYFVQSLQSFQATLDRMANTIITQYGLLTPNLPASLMTAANAEIVLDGLNNASTSKLSQNRIDLDLTNFVSGYFDIDGGTMYDTYTNAATFDGGGF